MATPKKEFTQRARPLLGTLVKIRLSGLSQKGAERAFETGFGVIEKIHRLMSFHSESSDLSRLNRDAAHAAIAVDPHTFAVLSRALELSRRTAGVFDVTIAPRLVRSGFLPRPDSAAFPARQASWRDIQLADGNRVRFLQPLWIDLGGIAKGYAVDQALAAMALPADVQVVIDAGGDIRVSGPMPQRILLRAPLTDRMAAVVELQDGSLSSSGGRDTSRRLAGRIVGPYIDGTTRKCVGVHDFVSVLTHECVLADALTKFVLAQGSESGPKLRELGAHAYLYRSPKGWLTLGQIG